jgi:hypothetical protein
MKLKFSRQIFEKYPNITIMKIRPVGADLFHADRQPDGHDRSNISVSAILRTHLKTEHVKGSGNLVRRQGPPPSAEVKNEWRYSFTPPYVFVTCTCRVRLKPDGTRWRTGGEVKGKLANGMGRQYSHTTSERGLSSITNADAHTSDASTRLNWSPRRFKWTRPFRRKTKSGFCACAITFQTHYTTLKICSAWRLL